MQDLFLRVRHALAEIAIFGQPPNGYLHFLVP